MTTSPHAPPLEFAELDEVLTLLRERGHRVSATLRAVLEALFEAAGPISAQFIATRASERGQAELELTSVYRNLERLEGLGVVKHFHLGHGPGLYMLVGTGRKEFLACERCGRVASVEPGELDEVRDEISRRFGYSARFDHFPIIGLCAECAGDRADAGAGHSHQHSHGHYVHSHTHEHEGGAEHVHEH